MVFSILELYVLVLASWKVIKTVNNTKRLNVSPFGEFLKNKVVITKPFSVNINSVEPGINRIRKTK